MSPDRARELLDGPAPHLSYNDSLREALEQFLKVDFLELKHALGDSDWHTRLAEHLGAGTYEEFEAPDPNDPPELEFIPNWEKLETCWGELVDHFLGA